jgi:hypothetical protein
MGILTEEEIAASRYTIPKDTEVSEGPNRFERIVDQVDAGVNSALNTATFGASGVVERNVGALGDYLYNQAFGDEPLTMEEARERMRTKQQVRREGHPTAHTLGSLAGAVASGVTGPRVAQPLVKALQGTGPGSRALATRTGLTGTGAAAQTVGSEIGEGTLDPTDFEAMRSRAATSAVLGVGGNLGGELVSNLRNVIRGYGKAGAKETGEGLAAAGLLTKGEVGADDVATRYNATNPFPQSVLEEASERAGPGRLMGEVDPRFAAATEDLIPSPNLRGATEPAATRGAAITEEVAEKRAEFVDAYFRPEQLKGEAAASLASDRAGIGQRYAKAMAHPSAKKPSVSRRRLASDVHKVFTDPVLPKVGVLRDEIKDTIAKTTGGDENWLTPEATLEIKKSIDKTIDNIMKGANTDVPGDVIKKLSEAKEILNTRAKNRLPVDLRRAATEYSDLMNRANLREHGEKMMRPSVDASEFATYFKTLNPVEKADFIEGAMQSAFKKVDPGTGGVASVPKRVAGETRRKLEAILPEEDLDQFFADFKELEQLESFGKKLVTGSRQGARSKADTSGQSPIERIFDFASAGLNVAKPHTASFIVPARRLSNNPAVARSSDIALWDLLGELDPAARATKIKEMGKIIADAQDVMPTAGFGTGAGLANLEGSIFDMLSSE